MHRTIGLVLITLPFYLHMQTACAQDGGGTVQTTVGDFPIEMIPTFTPFNDGSAIHAQEERFRREGQVLAYGESVAAKAKTSLNDYQNRLNQAIAANSFKAAWKILSVSQQTVAQAEAIDAQIFRFANNKGSVAYNHHMAADADLAAAKQTLATMEAAMVPEAKRELASAAEQQADQDKELAASAAAQRAAEAWDNKITGSLGELSACFDGKAPSSAVNCNVFVGRTLESVYGVADFKAADGHYLLANDVADYLVTSPKWTLVGTADNQSALEQAANSAGSHPVVAVWRNPDLQKAGHVVLIGPGPLLPSGTWGLNVPNYAGFSQDNPTARRIGDKLSWAFETNQKSEVTIYVRQDP